MNQFFYVSFFIEFKKKNQKLYHNLASFNRIEGTGTCVQLL